MRPCEIPRKEPLTKIFINSKRGMRLTHMPHNGKQILFLTKLHKHIWDN